MGLRCLIISKPSSRLACLIDIMMLSAWHTVTGCHDIASGDRAVLADRTCRALLRRHVHHHRGLVRATSSADDNERVDIDLLAKQLSREAERLRRSQSGQEATTTDSPTQAGRQWGASSDAQPGPFGLESKQQEAAVLAEVGDGGFSAGDFEILLQLGRLSWLTESPPEDPLQLARNTVQQQTAIIAFTARYYSGMPFQEPVTVLLKEYLPGARAVAANELQALVHLCGGLPPRKWHAASAPLSAELPVVPILGYFLAGQSDAGAALTSQTPSSPDSDVLWLAYKFERLQPLSYYAAAEQLQPMGGLLWGARDDGDEALRARCQMVRAISAGLLRALAFCHGRGVAHGSLGPGSVLLSTFEDRRARELAVKLDNFGFARLHRPAAQSPLYPSPQALDADHPLALAQREDLRAAGLALLETAIAALADGGPSDTTASDALQRLLCDVFSNDVAAFRRHCRQEPDWATPSVLLDEYDGAGWALVTDLIQGTKSAQELLANPFVVGIM